MTGNRARPIGRPGLSTIRRTLGSKNVKYRWLISAAVALGLASAAQAGDADAGRAKATTCAACHGPTGVSTNPLWPNLAGQKEAYLVKQIQAFKDGTRNDPSMTPMVSALSEEDIADIAAFFASQGCE